MNARPRRIAATLVAGVLLLALGATPAAAADVAATTSTGALPLRDSFTAGFGDWRLVTDGAGRITTDRGKTGPGMRLRSPGGAADRAYARYELSSGTNGITASAWFRVMSATCDPAAGWSRGNIPFFRAFDASGRRIAGVFAIKAPCGSVRRVYVQHSHENYYPTTGRIALRAWSRITFSLTVSTPGRSLLQVWLADKRIYSTTVASNGLDAIAAIQLGNEHLGQQTDLVVDDVRIDARAATPPAADTCTPGTPAPAPTVTSGSVVIASGFEDRTLADWDVRLAGTGTVTVESTFAHDGTCAAHLRSTTTALSRAMLWATLPASATDAAAEGWFLVQREGTARSNVPFFRLMRGSARSIDVYRQNATGMLWLAVREGATTTRTKLNVTVPLGEWHQVAVHANATTGTVEVWLDGALATTAGRTYALGATPFTRVILGNDAASQRYDLWVDSVVISATPAG